MAERHERAGDKSAEDDERVIIMKQGFLNKQGGARGGRKNWKRRWFVLKEDSLYYYSNAECTSLLGVMPIHGSVLLDLEAELPVSEPPQPKFDEKVCHECKKMFSLTVRKHPCKHCGKVFCGDCATRSIPIPKFALHDKVRVCESCYDIIKQELEQSRLAVKDDNGEFMGIPFSSTAAPHHAKSASNKMRKFTLPSQQKPHLFALKNSERELWIQADTMDSRIEWVNALKAIQNKHKKGGAFDRAKTGNNPAAAGAPKDGVSASTSLVQQSSPNWEIDFSAVSILNRVGVGAFGEVYRARLWGTEIAVKTLKTEEFESSDKVLEELKKEISILSGLRHPNIVLYIGACTKPPNVCIMTEWCSRGSLYDVLHDHSSILTAKLILDIAMGIAQGMNYLHSLEKRIIHRDLKSHNVLLTKSYQVKVADFGLSHVREGRDRNMAATWSINGLKPSNSSQPSGRHYGIFGTPEWMAPEVMEGAQYTEKIDVYSFGILLSELLTRQMPFHDIYNITTYMDVVDAVLDNGAIPTIPKWCENFLKPLILECLSRNPKERPSFTDIILKLREFSELDESIYFYQFDIPRIREMLQNRTPTIQALGAKEVWTMVKNRKIKRTSGGEIVRSPTKVGSPLTSGSASLPPSSALTKDESKQQVYNLNNPPQQKKSAAKKPDEEKEQGPFQLDDDDSSSLQERFVALLESPHSQVQLWSCRALSALLRCCDGPKAAQDREFLISEGAIRPLLYLISMSSNTELQREAAEVLLLLCFDVSSFEVIEKEAQRGRDELKNRREERERLFNSLQHFQSIMSDDMRKRKEEIEEKERQLSQMRLLGSCVTHAIKGEKISKEEAHERMKLLRRNAKEKRGLDSGGSGSSSSFEEIPSSSSGSADRDGSSQLPWDEEKFERAKSQNNHHNHRNNAPPANNAANKHVQLRPPPIPAGDSDLSDSDSPTSPRSPVSQPSSPINRKDPAFFQNIALAVDDTSAHLARVDSPSPRGIVFESPLSNSPGYFANVVLNAADSPPPVPPHILTSSSSNSTTEIIDYAPISPTPAAAAQRKELMSDGRKKPPPPPGPPPMDASRTRSPTRNNDQTQNLTINLVNAETKDAPIVPAAAFFEKDMQRTRKYTGADKEKYTLFENLVQILKTPALSAMPSHFAEHYANIFLMAGYLLRYEGERDTWQLCYALLFPLEMRIFDDVKADATSPSIIIRTKTAQGLPTRVRTGSKHGLPYCFSLEDCGYVYTYCSSSAENMNRWRDAICETKESRRKKEEAANRSPSKDAQLREKLRAGIPILQGVPPAFAKHFPHISHHSYLMMKDNDNNEWRLYYFVLIGAHMRVFENHKASPMSPMKEFDVDQEYIDSETLDEIVNRPHFSSEQKSLGQQHSQTATLPISTITAVTQERSTATTTTGVMAALPPAPPPLRTYSTKSSTFKVRLDTPAIAGPAAVADAPKAIIGLCAASPAEREKWLVAILGEDGVAKLSSQTPSKILPFIAFYSHVDFYGMLFRKRKYSNRWVKEFFLLVDSEVHYYTSIESQPDKPRGTFYICTNSGKAFPIASSSKRPYCVSIQNPHRTFYLAAESEKEYLGWINAMKANVKALSDRQTSRKTF